MALLATGAALASMLAADPAPSGPGMAPKLAPAPDSPAARIRALLQEWHLMSPAIYGRKLAILVKLHEQNALTDAEFEKAREKLIDEGVFGPRALDQPPQLVSIGQIPPGALANGPGALEGSATIAILIGRDGRVRDVRIVATDNPQFAVLAAAAMRQNVYRPAMKEGRPVGAAVTKTLSFSITNIHDNGESGSDDSWRHPQGWNFPP